MTPDSTTPGTDSHTPDQPTERLPSTSTTSSRRRIIGNGLWGAGQQTVLTGLNAITALLLISAVSVSDYGVYSYAIALCTIGSSLMTAGLNSLAVKHLVNDRTRNATIVTSLVLIREGFAVLGYVAIALLSLTSGSSSAVLATLLGSLALFGRALDAPEAWFLSHLRSKEPARIRIAIALTLFGVRLGLVLMLPNIWLLLSLFVLESCIASSLVTIKYLRARDSPGFGAADAAEARTLVRHSWPLLLSGLANQLNLKGGIVVVQAMSGTGAVGVFAAATRISELAYLLPVVFMNSTLPVLLETRKAHGRNSPEYNGLLQRSYDQAFWAGIAVGAATASVGAVLITTIFHDSYAQALPVLLIQLCASPFVFMAAVYSKWIIAEGILWNSLLRHSLGACANIALCVLLIPDFGVRGAAIASLVSYIAASYVAAFATRSSRHAAVQMTLAIGAPVRYAYSLSRRRRRSRNQ